MTLSTSGGSAAVIGEIAGREVALRFSGVAREYAALRDRAMLVDRSHRTRMVFEGPHRLETVTGLVTNDVSALTPGAGLYAAALTPRGKIIADVRMFAIEHELLVDVPARAAAGWSAMIRKYVNPRLSQYTDRTEATATLGLYGVRARDIVARLTGLEDAVLGALGPYAHTGASVHEHPVRVARVPDLGLEGFDLFMSADARAAVWQRAVDAGALPGGMDAWDVARVEAGRPEWGVDIDENTIPQEANLDELHAISYTKGCYTGQETVARVHFRGHVNRHLRGLLFPTPDAVPTGAGLVGDAEKAVGEVRSSVLSPRLGAIALGMVRREVDPGSTVRVRWAEFDVPAQVIALPFPADGA